MFTGCMVSACVFLYTERSSSTDEEPKLHGDKRHKLLHEKSDQGERSALWAHEGKVPCEFCSSLFPFDGIMPHQVLYTHGDFSYQLELNYCKAKIMTLHFNLLAT